MDAKLIKSSDYQKLPHPTSGTKLQSLSLSPGTADAHHTPHTCTSRYTFTHAIQYIQTMTVGTEYADYMTPGVFARVRVGK